MKRLTAFINSLKVKSNAQRVKLLLVLELALGLIIVLSLYAIIQLFT